MYFRPYAEAVGSLGLAEMDHRAAIEVLRLHRLEERAHVHYETAMRTGNTARAIKAARLETAVNAKIMSVLGQEIRPYAERD